MRKRGRKSEKWRQVWKEKRGIRRRPRETNTETDVDVKGKRKHF